MREQNMANFSSRVKTSSAKALILRIAGLLACCGLLAALLHSLVGQHRCLYEFVGRKWAPFFEARRRLRDFPKVDHIPPLALAKDRYEPGIAYGWQLGSWEELHVEIRDSELGALGHLMDALSGRNERRAEISNDPDAPLIPGVSRIRVPAEICMRGYVYSNGSSRLPTRRKGLKYATTHQVIDILDQEVYPFSRLRGAGALIWAEEGWADPRNIFVAGVRPEVASTLQQAMSILADFVEYDP